MNPFRPIAAALAVAALAVGGEAFAQDKPAASQVFAPPPAPRIPASLKRRPVGVPADAVLLVFRDSPEYVEFIYYFPSRIRDLKDGYDVRTANYPLWKRKPSFDFEVVSLSAHQVSCGYPTGSEFYSQPVAPGRPIGMAQFIRRGQNDNRASNAWSLVSLRPEKPAEISRWLDSSPSDAEWSLVGIPTATMTLLDEPMEADPNRGDYTEQFLIRAVCSSRPIRHRPVR